MPFQLPPISRREFLKRSILTGLGAALGQQAFAATRPTDANFWALFSDTHLAADRTQVNNGTNMADHFEQVSRELLSSAKRPAGLFITGDCAFNKGEAGDYAMLTGMLDPIRAGQIPVHIALGNHDNRERFWETLSQEKVAKRPLTNKQVALLETRHANWFILDSLETTLSTPGLLGSEQLDWLGSALDANSKKPALVLVHHNPGFSGNLGLKDTAPFMEIIRARRQVKAYIYGHTHTWKIEQDTSGIHLINLPPVAYVFRQGDPSGWVRADLRSDGLRLELRCLDQNHKAHGQTADLKWRA
jgi:3',5'-cyclic AMP phosphodiesterase CpdA